MLVPLERSSAVLVMISSKSVSICNRFHGRWANSGKITISKGGYPSLMPSFEGNLLTQRHQHYLVTKLDSGLSYSEDFMILSCVVLTQYSSVTDRQTDGRTVASAVAKTRLALHAVARKNHKQNQSSMRDTNRRLDGGHQEFMVKQKCQQILRSRTSTIQYQLALKWCTNCAT